MVDDQSPAHTERPGNKTGKALRRAWKLSFGPECPECEAGGLRQRATGYRRWRCMECGERYRTEEDETRE